MTHEQKRQMMLANLCRRLANEQRDFCMKDARREKGKDLKATQEFVKMAREWNRIAISQTAAT